MQSYNFIDAETDHESQAVRDVGGSTFNEALEFVNENVYTAQLTNTEMQTDEDEVLSKYEQKCAENMDLKNEIIRLNDEKRKLEEENKKTKDDGIMFRRVILALTR